ncbi:MAG: LysR family transcriptional regulator [Rhodobacteraceae bacterium]|nr:LysR family transcriptional regulator [Paracoccaceae bacterium]
MKSELRNWSDIRVFLAVIREGSTLAASRKLGVAQPTVARRIDTLEHETGLTLFERDTRGFKPTRAAHSLIPLAESIEDCAKRFAAKTRELAKPRPIRITAPGYFSDRVMEIFSEFSALNPGVAIEFVHSMRLLNLADGEADIAVRVGTDAPDDALICRTIGTERWALFGGRSYADKFDLPKTADDLRGHRFVTFQREDAPDWLHDWLLRNVSPTQIVMSFSELDLMIASIKAGHGLGLVVVRFAESDAALVRCSGNIDELARPVTMLIAPDAYRRPEVKAFTKFFAPRYAAMFD